MPQIAKEILSSGLENGSLYIIHTSCSLLTYASEIAVMSPSWFIDFPLLDAMCPGTARLSPYRTGLRRRRHMDLIYAEKRRP